MENSALRKSLISVFQESFASINKIFILVGGTEHWAIMLWGLNTFLIFPNFQRS